MLTNWRDLQDRNDTTPEGSSWMEGAETPLVPSCRKWEVLWYQASVASSCQDQHSHALSCPTPIYLQPCRGSACPSMQQSQCSFCMRVRALCICECPHHLWWRCQAGTYSLAIHLPHWQSLRHPAHLHWPHLQKGLWRFHLMLLWSGQTLHIHWLGTLCETHHCCQIQSQNPMSLMSLRNFVLIHDLTRNPSQRKRRNWTTSDVEREI